MGSGLPVALQALLMVKMAMSLSEKQAEYIFICYRNKIGSVLQFVGWFYHVPALHSDLILLPSTSQGCLYVLSVV